jgi:PAS domain S-box-containing protein
MYEEEQELFTLRRPLDLPASFQVSAFTPGAIAEVLSETRLGRTGAAIIATTSEGDVTYWSPRAARLYGWAVEEALGRNILDLTPALQSRAEAESIMDRLRAGNLWEGEIVLRTKDGTPFSAYVCDLPIGRLSDGDGAIVGVSVAARHRGALEGSCHALATELGLRIQHLEVAARIRREQA